MHYNEKRYDVNKHFIHVIIIAWCFVLIEYALRVSDSVIITQLQAAFTLSAKQIGVLSSAYYFTYVSCMLPAGILIDRYGLYRIWQIALSILGLGSLVFALKLSYGIAIIARIAMGFGSSFAVIGVFALIIDKQQAGKLIGLTMAVAMLGAVLGQGPWLQLTHYLHNWTGPYYLASVVLIGLLMLWRYYGHNVNSTQVATQSFSDIFKTFTILLRSPVFWILAIFMGVLSTPQTAFMALWGPSFLHLKYHLSATQSAFLTSIISIGAILGGLFFGCWVDKTKFVFETLLVVSGVTIMLMLCLIQGWILHSLSFLSILLFLIGFFTTANVMIFTYLGRYFRTQSKSTVQSAANMFNMGGGPIFQIMIGQLITWQMLKHSTRFTLSALQTALYIIPVILLIVSVPLVFATKKEPHL